MKTIVAIIMSVFTFAVARDVASWTGLDFNDVMLGGLTFLLYKTMVIAILDKEGDKR